MSSRHDTLTSYVPWLLIDSLERNPNRRTQPFCERLESAVLVADMSGFTALTETLVQQGPIGVEELSITLNAYFGQLIELVISHGGDIVEFTGDGILVLWPTRTTHEDLATVAYRAAQCGLAAQQMLALQSSEETSQLSLRIGIGAGTVLIATVGGMLGRWELLVAGDPITQASRAEGNAQPGEVVLSAQSWALVQSWCLGYPVGYTTTIQAAEVGGKRSVVYTSPEIHSASCRISEMCLEDTRHYLAPHPLPVLHPCPDVLDVLRGYVPAALVARLDAGQSDWVAELRRVTILFVNLHGIAYEAPDILEQLQSCMNILQTILYRYEGSLNQFIVDDKGTLLIAALGLPPLTHEDDAARGVHLALDIQKELQETTKLRCAIGITTGRIFSGSRGSIHRRDYAMIGDSMNLAARLMVKAAPDGILCDAATYRAARNNLTFEALTPIKVRGKSLPVDVYRPYDQPSPAICSTTPFVGRTAEQKMLLEWLDKLHQDGNGGIVVIEGEAGMGKSRLVNCMLQYVQKLPIVALIGHADSMEHSTPYHVWRAIFSQLFGLDESHHQSGMHGMGAFELIHYDSVCMQLAPLLSAVLPLDIPDNHITSHMSGHVRADNTRDVLVQLLRVASRRAALLLILEDANWMDSSSWALALTVSQKIPSVLLIITTRPLTGSAAGSALIQAHLELEMAKANRPSSPHKREAQRTNIQHAVLSVQHSIVTTKPFEPTHNYDHVLNRLNAHRIVLTSLPADDVQALIAQSLGVDQIARSVISFIVEKAQGNPFFAQELAYGLRDAGLIVIDDGVCQPSSDTERLDVVNFPVTLHGVIVSRIDRLSAAQQLLLKIASVIGETFEFGLLYDVYPLAEDRVRLLDELQQLEKLDVVVLKIPAPELVYGFKHVITRQVVYDMLLFGQRRDVHRTVAEWYERHYADDLSQWYERLMYHWGEVGDSFRELVYATKAGEYALQNFAREEAVLFLMRARVLLQNIAIPSHDAEQNRSLPITIEKLLGEAYLGLGKLHESRQHLEKAATLAGYPVPSYHIAMIAQMCGQIVIQSMYLMRADLRKQCSGYQCSIIQEAAHIYGVLFRINFLANDVLPALHAALRCLNISGKSPQTAWQCYANANMCSIAGSAGLHRLARWYGRRALQIGWQNGDIPALTYALNMNGLYRIGIGDWRGARGALEQGLLFCKHMGDWTLWGLNQALLAQMMYFQGHFATAYTMARELYTRAQQRDNVLQQLWARVGMGQSALRLGKLNEARAILEDAVNTMTVQTERPGLITSYGLLAMTRVALGDTQGGRDAAQTASRLIAAIPIPFAHRLLEGYAGVAEVYLSWYEECGANAPPDVVAQAHTACRHLRLYAQSLPIGKPRACTLQGWCAWLDGKHNEAFVLWRRGLSDAQELGMAYEEGLAHAMIGRHSQGAPRAYHLNRARDIFRRLNARTPERLNA